MPGVVYSSTLRLWLGLISPYWSNNWRFDSSAPYKTVNNFSLCSVTNWRKEVSDTI